MEGASCRVIQQASIRGGGQQRIILLHTHMYVLLDTPSVSLYMWSPPHELYPLDVFKRICFHELHDFKVLTSRLYMLFPHELT